MRGDEGIVPVPMEGRGRKTSEFRTESGSDEESLELHKRRSKRKVGDIEVERNSAQQVLESKPARRANSVLSSSKESGSALASKSRGVDDHSVMGPTFLDLGNGGLEIDWFYKGKCYRN